MARKYYGAEDVYQAAIRRIEFVFDHFDRLCIAFSGGKDSSVLLHLVLEVAQKRERGPIDVLFIDLEAQYQATIQHVRDMFEHKNIRAWWICLPLNLRNASSLHEPYWCAWEPGREAEWVRPLPDHPAVISNPNYFPFYRYRMEFEEFVTAFNEWLAQDTPTASLVGIRSDESLNRYLAVKSRFPEKKSAWRQPNSGLSVNWSSCASPDSRNISFFPIYDWKFSDIWHYTHLRGHSYNRIYDEMYRAGLPFSQMRICQPYGDDQRKGIDLFHKLEPQTWFKVVKRVAGANYAARYSRQRFLGYRGGLGLPPRFNSWKQYSHFLLYSIPEPLRTVYTRRIERFIEWWSWHSYPLHSWPDAGEPALENRKAQPSWRRVALSLLKQDMARSLSFGFARQDLDLMAIIQQNHKQ